MSPEFSPMRDFFKPELACRNDAETISEVARDRPMDTILLVEDSSFFEKAVTRSFRRADGFDIVVAKTCAEATAILREDAARFAVALVDLSLPDTTDVETVDLTTAFSVPTIVFSSRFDSALQSRLYAKGIVDYVLKDSPASLSYLRELVLRLRSNRGIGALLLESGQAPLGDAAEQLRRLQLSVTRVTDPKDALQQLNEHEHIRLLVLDQDLPGVDAIDLIKQVRLRRGPEKVAVVSLTEGCDQTDMVRLLKSGANEALAKTCPPEEFLLRVGQNLDTIDRILKLTDAANHDAMTGLHNRRFLFDAGTRLYVECRRSEQPVPVALIDVDRFKQVNDHYGHEAGDLVIKNLAEDLVTACGSGVLAVRLGGDEFCMLMPGCEIEEAKSCCAAVYSRFRARAHVFGGERVDVTLSIGLSSGYEDDLEEAIRAADEQMYAAKSRGRDRIIAKNDAIPRVEERLERFLLDV